MPGAAVLGRARGPDRDHVPDAAGRAGRPATAAGPRAAHDAIIAAVPSTARGTIAVVTSLGRMIRVGVLEIPALPPSAHSPACPAARPSASSSGWRRARPWSGSPRPMTAGAGLALGTAGGVVKRVAPDYPGNATDFEVIALKDGDRVVGAVQLASEDQDLVFITSDAQLLRFGARRSGRRAAPRAGWRASGCPRGASVIWFGAVTPAVAGGRGRQDFPGGDPAGGRSS